MLFVFVAAIIAVGSILLWQKKIPAPQEITILPQDETADWQTYRNEEYGFEFKYPPNIVNMAGENLDTIWTEKSNDCLSGGFDYKFDGLNSFSMLVCPLGDKTFNQWILDQDASCIIDLENVLDNAKNVKVGGKPGIEIIDPPGLCPFGDSILIKTYFSDNHTIYTFAFSGTKTSEAVVKEEREKVFSQILSTFKFTK